MAPCSQMPPLAVATALLAGAAFVFPLPLAAAEAFTQPSTGACDPGTRVADDMLNADVIFCGNPGVGKSTLLSSVSRLQFESGLNWGEGKTNRLELQESRDLPGFRFGDTPGLSDINMAERAAAAITEGLNMAAKQRRAVKIFFVVTTEAGRIRPDDLFTIKQVMGSIVLPDGKPLGLNSYGLIVNKCHFLERPDFRTKGAPTLRMAVGVPSATVPFTTSYIKFVPNLESIAIADNATVEFDGLRDFVLNFPGIEFIEGARTIDVSSLEEKLRESKQQHARDLEALEQRLRNGHRVEIEGLEQELGKSRADLEKKLKEAQRNGRRGGLFGILGDFFDALFSL